MNVSHLTLESFTKHASTKLALPQSGLVLVTGKNGGGKSSIIEAVSYGCWGKTLRGTQPWQSGSPGVVEVQIAGKTVRREWNGKRVGLTWDSTDYETTTKAQEALERVIGSHDVWRRSSVFSSADASTFTQATDSERKRLLEAVLGLGVFDEALDAAKLDLRAAEADRAKLLTKAAELDAHIAHGTERIAELEAQLAALPAPVDLDALHKREATLAQLVADAAAQMRKLVAERARVRAEADAARSNVARAERALKAAQGYTHCDSCKRPIAEESRKAVLEKHAAELAAAQAALASLQQQGSSDEEYEEVNEEGETLKNKLDEVRKQLAQAQPAERLRLDGNERLAKTRQTLDSIKQQRAVVDVVAAEKLVAELEAVVQVLGIKGVRAHVLGRALTGLEAAANAWLARIAGGGLSLSLKPYSEKKTGGTSDSISLEVSGAGGGFGYAASSGGERRRIDVALLLALAQIAHAASGRVGAAGTLFFDEVFDALDEDGVDAVVQVLADLSRERAVVVISHSQALSAKLAATVRWSVEGGAVRVS